MQSLSAAAVRTVASSLLPSEIRAQCPSCVEYRIFAIGGWKEHGNMRYATAPCPGCNRDCFFVVADYTAGSSKPLGGGKLFMHPASAQRYASIELADALEVYPELKNDYLKAIQYYNTQDFSGLTLAARRMLEGLTRMYLPNVEEREPLQTSLTRLAKERDLGLTIGELSNALKDAGNLGAHFGSSRVSQEIATSAMQMAEEFLTLHVLLEKRVTHFKHLVAEAKARKISPPNSSGK